MQLSNGLADPIGLWLGHLMFDLIFSVSAATIIIIIFATAATQLHGLGLFVSCFEFHSYVSSSIDFCFILTWVVLVLYGIAGTLFAYCVSLVTASPLAAFATVAGYQFVMGTVSGNVLPEMCYSKTSIAVPDRILVDVHVREDIAS